MAVPRPKRRATLLLYTALLLTLLSGLALCLPRLLTGARASNAVFNATLGNYPDTSIELGGNSSVAPDAAPVDATTINVSTNPLFKGTLEADPSTGVVRVTNAHPAGTYTVRLFAFDPNTGTTDTKSFQLTVTTTAPCSAPALVFQSATLNAAAGSAASAVGDFNGDGKQDIVTANSGANNVSVNLGDGAGGFNAPTIFVVGSQPRSVAVGDFDGDGAQDLAVANSGANNVAIFLGNGDGTFNAGATVGVGATPTSVAVADFNNDARQDLVTADSGTVGASILLGDGNGGFVFAGSPAVGNNPRSVAVGDFNKDGNADIVTANNTSNDIAVRLGNGTGSFDVPMFFNAASKPESVVVADFNNDGNQDVATANSGANSFSVFTGTATGSMVLFNNNSTGTAPFSLDAGDFDGDGNADIVTANSGSNNVSVIRGAGTGGFEAIPSDFAAGTTPRSVAVADFNGDGKQDLVVANSGSGTVTVLVRRCTPPAGTLVVTNTNDSGAGSLRQAITIANNAPGVQTIAFQILGAGVHTISLLSALPDITDRVVIDGLTQPGFAAGTPLVELNGAGAGQVTAGLNVVSGGSTIRGLAVNNFNGHGIRLGTAGGNTVRSNFIGTNAAVAAAAPNTGHGVFIDNTPNNSVGGAAAGEGNVISGNTGQGVRVDGSGATGNQVAGNFIGTDLSGAAAVPNTGGGVMLAGGASGNTIGATAGNTVSGNGSHGVLIQGPATNGNLVQSNFIGTNTGGNAALGNSGSGVFVSDSPGNLIGGQGSGNVISANQNHGVLISGAGAAANVVASNRIGTSENSFDPLGNALDGVRVDNASGNTVGGMTDVEANTVAFNGQDGVGVNAGAGNRILGNSIHDNGTTAQHLGIDLSPDGVNANDVGDADAGANNRQNFPALASALLTGGGNIRIAGALNSTANSIFRVEFFSGGACDASGFGEGAFLINSTDVTTDAAGNASFNVNFSPTDVSTGDSVTATATNTATGDTSEFSQCVPALQAAVWNGSSDSNWHNGFNWNNDLFPTASRVIIIPSTGVTNEPAIFAADAEALSVVVQSGRTLTVGSARTLTTASVNVEAGATLNVPAGETGRVNGDVNLSGPLTGGAGSVFDFLGSQILNGGTVSVPTFRFAGASQTARGPGVFTSADTVVVNGSTVTLGTNLEFGALTVNNNATLDQSGNSTLTVGRLTIDSGGLLKNLGGGDLLLKGDVANAGTIQLNGAGAACGDADTILVRSSAAGAQRAWTGSGTFQLTDVDVQDQAGSAAIQVLSGTNSGNVGANWTFATCAGVPLTFSVSGRVVNASNQPIVGVNVHLDGATARDTTTDANGNYTFAGLAQQGNFTVTPTETNYRFTPPSRGVNNLQSDQTNVDFEGALVNHAIAGTILDGEGRGVSGVTVTLAGAQSALTTTDSGGNYSFANVPEGGSFTVTPDKEGFTFNPPRRQIPNITADVDFDAVATAQASPTPTPDPSDDFSGGPDPDFDKWSKGILTNPPTAFDPLVEVFLAGGLLHIQPRDDANGLSFGGLVSAHALDIDRTPVVSVEVVAASQGEGAQTLFGLGRDQDNWLRFAVQDASTVPPSIVKTSRRAASNSGVASDNPSGQTLLFEVNVAGSKTSFGIDYDPSVQRFWRFRFDAPARTVVFETSPDSATWTVRFSAALPADQTALIAELSAGTFKATESPTEALFDNYLLSPTPRVQFAATAYNVKESDGTAQVQVIRTGSDESPAAVNFATSDGTARAGVDYAATSGTITFAIGERSKTVNIPIINDNALEDEETINLTLTNSVGAQLGSITSSVLTILDDESPNQIDQTAFFVRQHYLDFLGREPDAAGLQFWTNNIESCGANAQCREVKRIDTSAAFFLSIEFQETGLVVQRFYEASFNRPPTFDEYLPDLTVIREGVIVGQPDAMARLEANKRLFAELWVNRAAFKQTFGGLNEMQYVDTLLSNAGITLAEGERTALIVGLLTNRETRAGVLLKVIEKEEFKRRELNAAFVRMEYFGYLRRTPDPVGFAFWLKKLDDNGGDYRRAEMVKAFITSTEYRARFGRP